MNLKNIIENLIILIVCFTMGGIVGYKASLKAVEQTLEINNIVITEAIKKETTKIENNLTNTFEKKALKKGENIQIIIDPTTNSVISRSDTSQIITVENKKGFFKRIFQKDK